MIIEINAINAKEARELGRTYRNFESKANEQLAIAAAMVIETKIMPAIKQDAKTQNFSYFESYKKYSHWYTLDEFIQIVKGQNTIHDYHFDYGFRCEYKDNNGETYSYVFAPCDIFAKITEMLTKLGYSVKIEHEYSSGYYKDFSFNILW